MRFFGQKIQLKHAAPSTPKELPSEKFKPQSKLSVRKQSRIKTAFAGGTSAAPFDYSTNLQLSCSFNLPIHFLKRLG